MNKKEYFESIRNKTIKISKKDVNGYVYYYNGNINEVFDNEFLFNDIKVGKILLTFDNVSVLTIKGVFD